MKRANAVMSSARRWQFGALLAVFWFAQVQGVVHEISHLNDSARVAKTQGVPKPQSCPECLSLAQAGAAPISTAVTVHAGDIARYEPASSRAALVSHAPQLAYRSRAPPLSLI